MNAKPNEKVRKHLKALRELMAGHKLDVYLVPSADEHQNEYLPGHKKRREAISGFSGSAGFAPQPKSLYAVSLLNTKSRTIADQFSEQWVTKIPTLKTVKINEVYFVFTGTKPLAEQEAIEIAVRLKKQGHKPELIRLK